MTARPSVLLVTDALAVGGLERVVVETARELAHRGWRVGVLAGPGPLWDELPEGVVRHALRFRDPVRAALRIRALVRSQGYRLVHAHQRGVALAATLGVRGLRVPVVEHVHNVFAPTAAARLLSFRGDALIACGSAVAEMLVDGFGRRTGRVHIVRNGVRDPFPAGPLARPVDPPLRVVGVGRLTEQKDPERFVRVVAALDALLGRGAVTAEWVGDGPLMPVVRSAVAVAGLVDVLDLPGELPDASARIAAADLLLLTSRWEGLPLVALEALASGRGLVLPDVGSCCDALTAETGLLFAPGISDAELAAGIADAARSGAVRSWQQHARGAWETGFTFDAVVDGVEQVFATVGVERAAIPAVRA